MSNRIPRPIIRFTSGSMPIELLICGGKEESDYPWAKRFIGGWPLPSWQRGLVWSVEEKVAFIESVFIGYDLGSVMINDLNWDEDRKMTTPMSEIIVDGQQRISALIGYVNNDFSINGLYWKDLTRIEQRDFRERQIGLKSISCFDEEKLKIVYNHLNFGGVRHKDNEKA
ncbi:hypothetical protein [Vibrio phage ST2-1pr]|uniref:DUF262 domain-containing protein n=1 Tax=Vibrio sp. St2 TaxID=2853441 RepID=UPI001C7614EA|nr:DUF262 domain-containing protein [Vibrio sp. St2]QXM18781.1 hypothetical protein [Vibrio phage ST2-1pr]